MVDWLNRACSPDALKAGLLWWAHVAERIGQRMM